MISESAFSQRGEPLEIESLAGYLEIEPGIERALPFRKFLCAPVPGHGPVVSQRRGRHGSAFLGKTALNADISHIDAPDGDILAGEIHDHGWGAQGTSHTDVPVQGASHPFLSDQPVDRDRPQADIERNRHVRLWIETLPEDLQPPFHSQRRTGLVHSQGREVQHPALLEPEIGRNSVDQVPPPLQVLPLKRSLGNRTVQCPGNLGPRGQRALCLDIERLRNGFDLPDIHIHCGPDAAVRQVQPAPDVRADIPGNAACRRIRQDRIVDTGFAPDIEGVCGDRKIGRHASEAKGIICLRRDIGRPNPLARDLDPPRDTFGIVFKAGGKPGDVDILQSEADLV